MRILKRIFWSITQQKNKYLLFLVSTFILGIVFSGILVLSFYIENVQAEFIQNYGAQISIYSSKKYNNLIMNKSVDKNKTEASKEMITKMFYDESIKYGDFSFLFKGLQSNDVRFDCSDLNIQNEDIYFWGTQKSEFVDLKKNKIKIVAGRSFSQEELEEGANVLIINQNTFYNGSNIQVGDVIKLSRNIYLPYINSNLSKDVIYSEEVEYEIIGLFEVNELYKTNNSNTIDNYETHAYVPNNTILNESKRFSELNLIYNNDLNNINNCYILGDAYFVLDSSEQLIKFETKYEDLFNGDSLPDGYFVYGTNEIYDKISKPVRAISQISNYLYYVSNICCISILGAVIFIVTKDRKKEIGILLSLGENKFKIIIQILSEIMLVGLLGLNLSSFYGLSLGNQLTQYMVESTIVDYSELLSTEENILQVEMMNDYVVELDIDYIIYINKIGASVLVIATFLSLITIINTNVKKNLIE